MRLVKLDAIDSTNDFLKYFSRRENLENFTVVTTENQTNGRGQMGSVWNSQVGKNLIMSVLIKNFIADATSVFDLNIAVSLAVIQSLQKLDIPELRIKWPNDIMSGNKKIGGILIENSFKSNQAIDSIVGIGINVNQTEFENLPQASSLILQTGVSFNKDELLLGIIQELKAIVENWYKASEDYKIHYDNLLFKKGEPMIFQKPDQSNFVGEIIGVNASGRLQILNENSHIEDFDLKEIKLLF